jgi:hypothetical protein
MGGATSLSIVTLSIMTFDIKTLNITIDKNKTFSIMTEHCYAECHMKSSGYELISTRRSTVLVLPFGKYSLVLFTIFSPVVSAITKVALVIYSLVTFIMNIFTIVINAVAY